MEITKRKNLVGGFITLIAGIAVPVLAIVLLFQNYSSLLKGYVTTGKPAGAIMQDIHQPLFSALLMFAGVLMLVSAVGYFGQKKWAFVYGFTGCVVDLRDRNRTPVATLRHYNQLELEYTAGLCSMPENI